MRDLLAVAAMAGLIALADISAHPWTIEARAGDTSGANAGQAKEKHDVKADAKAFLRSYQAAFAKLDIRTNLGWWKAANSGKWEVAPRGLVPRM